MKKILLWTASIILFLELMDTTILYTCLVPIADNFDINISKMSLAVVSYIVGTCVGIPIVSWLSNKYNKMNIIILTLIGFSIFSLLCSISTELYLFSVFRFFQGVTISIAASIIVIVLLSLSSNNDIVKTMGYINIPALIGTAIGPFIGAIFSYYLSWRIAFLINFPICIVLLWILAPLRSNSYFCNYLSHHEAFDWLGYILLALCLVTASVGFAQLSEAINIINSILIIIGISFAAMYFYMWQIRQKKSLQKNSILDLKVFKNTDFLFGIIVNIISRTAMCGLPVLLAMILQKYYHFSIIKAGFYLALIAFSGITAKLISAFITTFGIHRSVMLSAGLTSISILCLSPLNFWITQHSLWLPCIMLGFTMSLLYTSMNSVMYITLEKHEIPNASNVGLIIQQFCIGLGVVVTVCGYQLLLLANGFHEVTTHPISLYAFSSVCHFLSALMMLNLFVGVGLKINSTDRGYEP